MKITIEEIEQVVTAEISKVVKQFVEIMNNGTNDADNFITIDEIEKHWGDLKTSTDKIYTGMVSQILSTIDEREIVKKKDSSIEKGAESN